jgi:hypothetical protein
MPPSMKLHVHWMNLMKSQVIPLLGDVAKFTLYFTRILSELGQIHYRKSW